MCCNQRQHKQVEQVGVGEKNLTEREQLYENEKNARKQELEEYYKKWAACSSFATDRGSDALPAQTVPDTTSLTTPGRKRGWRNHQ